MIFPSAKDAAAQNRRRNALQLLRGCNKMWQHVSNVPNSPGTLETCRHILLVPLKSNQDAAIGRKRRIATTARPSSHLAAGGMGALSPGRLPSLVETSRCDAPADGKPGRALSPLAGCTPWALSSNRAP